MIELLKNNKLVTKSLQGWFTDKMRRAVKNSKNEEWQEHFINSEISIEKLAPILEINPRSLFDFFDENMIFILPIMNKEEKFSAKINGEPIPKYYFSRILAETAAVILAFPLLESNLDTYERKED